MSATGILRLLALVLFVGALPASAQITQPRDSQEPGPKLTLTTAPDRIRFTTPGETLDWRLEIANAQGETIFDSGFITSSALDWPLINQQDQPVESGLYHYTLTMKIGPPETLRLQRGQLTVERTNTLYQTAVVNDESGSAQVTTINLSQAPLAGSNAGATSSAAGSASESVPTALSSRSRATGSTSSIVTPLISGTGTTFSMTKWLDGPSGVVGDTNVTEQNGSVVVGNGTFRGNLQIFGPADKDVFAGMGPNLITGPGFNFGYAGESFGRSAGFFNVRPDLMANWPNPSLRFMTNNTQRMIITRTGEVGIGTTVPLAELAVRGNGADVLLGSAGCGAPTAAIGFGGPMSNCNNFALGGDVSNSASAGVYLNRPTGQSLHFREGNGDDQMVITPGGNIGIGRPSPFAKFMIRQSANPATAAVFWIEAFNGDAAFQITDRGETFVGAMLGFPSTTHICWDIYRYLDSCSSAAEYIATVKGVDGGPQQADLVSIALSVPNPYQDTHAPFVAVKSSHPCDANLLGFILDPSSGADGKKLNEHYLPLAIYGYFPAKVTTENGPIRRGDPITSSSKPGYGMKAPAGCRTIGYALEDADRDGTIQVFAHLSEYTAPAVVELRNALDALTRENQTLKERVSTFDARLTALERAIGNSPGNIK